MSQKTIDLSVLPEQARIEVEDFYEFIKAKYSHFNTLKQRDIARLIPRTVQSFTPLKRDEIYER